MYAWNVQARLTPLICVAVPTSVFSLNCNRVSALPRVYFRCFLTDHSIYYRWKSVSPGCKAVCFCITVGLSWLAVLLRSIFPPCFMAYQDYVLETLSLFILAPALRLRCDLAAASSFNLVHGISLLLSASSAFASSTDRVQSLPLLVFSLSRARENGCYFASNAGVRVLWH